MKLFLSSYRMGNDPQQLASLYGENKRVAIVPNALDMFPDGPRRDSGLAREAEDLSALGLHSEVIDLRSFYDDREHLADRLSEFGGVWVLGGNTFVLRKSYEKSGFDQWMHDHKTDEGFVYGGYSAGICVLAPSLKGIDLVDDTKAVNTVFGEPVVWNGLGLLDRLLVPHYDSDHPESVAMRDVVAYLRREGVKYQTLRDGDVVIAQSVDEVNREIRADLSKEGLF